MIAVKTNHAKVRPVTVIKYIVLIVTILSVFPLYWMMVAATNSSVDVIAGRLTFGTRLAENYQSLIGTQPLWRSLWNSVRYTVLQTFISVFVCAIAGYGFEIYHTKIKDRLMSIILLSMMLPFVVLMVPLFQMFSKVGLLNTAAGFILPSISTPFLIMLFRQASQSFPYELIDAARIDGLSEFSIFMKMYIPTMRSTFAAAITVTFMNAWNSYLWPKVIMRDNSSQTMPMLISNLTSGYFTDYGMLMLAVLLTTLPTAIVFLALQKSFTAGLTGSVKG